MTPERRAILANYIAKAMQSAERATKQTWPSETIIVTNSGEELAEIDEIVGMKIFTMNLPTSFPFFVAFPAENTECYCLQMEFLNYMELYNEK